MKGNKIETGAIVEEMQKQEYVVFVGDHINQDTIWKIWLMKKNKDIRRGYSLYLYNSFFKKSLYPFWNFRLISGKFCWIMKSMVSANEARSVESYEFLRQKEVYYSTIELFFALPRNDKLLNLKKMLIKGYWLSDAKLQQLIGETIVEKEEEKMLSTMLQAEDIVKKHKYLEYKKLDFVVMLVLFLKVAGFEVLELSSLDCHK